MFASNFNLTDYCQRIGYHGTPTANAATVSSLMQHQLRSIPFENLDVLAGKGISLVPEAIVDKLVYRQRGGYCYEVNGLFCMALSALGVPFRMVAARPMFYPMQRPRTHMALIVTLDGADWLYDLGFGSYGIRAPMRMDVLDTPVMQDFDTFMLTTLDNGSDQTEYILQAQVEGQWVKQYGFNLCPQEWIDFMPANWMNSTHPDAVFTQKHLLVRFTATGRTILFGENLKQIAAHAVSQRPVTAQDLPGILAEHFGLHLPD